MTCSDWVSLFEATGTLGAVVISLWLALRKGPRRFDATFIWEDATDYQPILLLQNTSDRIVLLKNLKVIYGHKVVCQFEVSESVTLSKHAILEAGQLARIPLASFQLKFPKPKDESRKYKLKVKVGQRNGRSCSYSTKLSYSDLQTRFFGQGLFS